MFWIMALVFLFGNFTINASHEPVRIAFVINELSFRGIEVSTYDYADYNEILLHNHSIIINFDTLTDNEVRKKFTERFPERFFDCASVEEMDYILAQENIDILYFQKPGHNDGIVSSVCKNAVHAVFPQKIEPHGDVYAFISEWFTTVLPQLNLPFVPYMVRVDNTQENLRKTLNIPDDAIVFGRHGGAPSFNVPCAQQAVKEVAQEHPEIYFLFLNTDEFCHLPNVIFLPKTTNMEYKAKFINTCDAMIHARWRGETFGLACAEFSVKNKPILSWRNARETAHIQMLGNNASYFSTKEELISLLLNFKKQPEKNWDFYSHKYSPEKVMQQFDRVFIQPLMRTKRTHPTVKKLDFKTTRLADGSLNPDFFKQLEQAFPNSRIIKKMDDAELLSLKKKSNENKSLVLFFDLMHQKNMQRKCAYTPPLLSPLLHCIALHDAVIVIDGIPMADPQEQMLIIKTLHAREFQVFVNGITLLAFKNTDVFVSPLIKAMTTSYFSFIDEYAQNIPLHTVLAAEKIIARALSQEPFAAEFNDCAATCPPSALMQSWQGLACYENKQYERAAHIFKQCINQGMQQWRFHWYLGQALYKLGDVSCEIPMLKVITDCPQFQGIIDFKKSINA